MHVKLWFPTSRKVHRLFLRQSVVKIFGRREEEVCSHLAAWIAGSNTAEGTAVPILCL